MQLWTFQLFVGASLVSTLLTGGTREYKITPIAPETSIEVSSSSLPILPADLMAAGGCESNDSPNKKPRQFDKDGEVIKHKNYNKAGVWTSTDYGAFQVNSIHLKEAAALGLDIMKELDNYKMAAIIYKSQGIGAWKGFDKARWNCSYYPKEK